MTPWSTKVLKEYKYVQQRYLFSRDNLCEFLSRQNCLSGVETMHLHFEMHSRNFWVVHKMSIYQLKISEIILSLNLVSKYLPPMIYPTILNPLNVIALIEFTENDGGNQIASMTLSKSLTGATKRLSRDKMVTSSWFADPFAVAAYSELVVAA